jgi:hypothetical protein
MRNRRKLQMNDYRNIFELAAQFLRRTAMKLPVLLIGIILLTGINNPLIAQETLKDSTKTGIERKKNRTKRGSSGDSLTFEQRRTESDRFYDNIKAKKQNNRILKNLYPLVFKAPPRKEISDTPEIADQLPFTEHNGKIIRSIQIKKLDIFGTSVHDTTLISQTRLENILNRTHINSRNAIIRKYLLIKQGDALNARAVADNEKVLRELSIFEDAVFYLRESTGNDSADLILVIKDIYPVGLDLSIDKFTRSRARFYNRNLWGLGNQIEQSMEFNSKKKPTFFLTNGGYTFRNISGTFIDSKAYWKVGPESRGLGLEITKTFVTPETRFAGGARVENLWKNQLSDPEQIKHDFPYMLYDVWVGYAPVINRSAGKTPLRTQAYITSRISSLQYKSLNPQPDTAFPDHYNLERKLLSIGIIKSGFVRRNMITGFGRTEDIPVGYQMEVTVGEEESDRANGFYTGLELTNGVNIRYGAHIFASANIGGYWNNKNFSNGAFNTNLSFISRLYKTGSSRMRIYGIANYTQGINRTNQQYLRITPAQFSKTFSNYDYTGHTRLNIKSEVVVFTPIYLLGFRCAFYGFSEIVMLSDKPAQLFKREIIPAFGFGIKVRNEHLVFSTFQFGFTFFPVMDNNNRYFLFGITDQQSTLLELLRINAPDVTEYR